jgi:DNA replication protein DnaC
LALLVQDEVARRDQKKYATRLRRAGFKSNKTLESFDLSTTPNLNRSYVQELASCGFIDEKVPVLIAGPCGTGKSHLAQAIGHCAVQKGVDVLFFTQAKLLANLYAARATNSYEKRFQTIAKVPLLIIDDFGLKPLKSPQDEDLHDLIDERYEQHATIITSNLDFTEWGDAFPNKLLGAATLDRLRHNAYRLILEGESYRKLRGENTTKTNKTGRVPKSGQ